MPTAARAARAASGSFNEPAAPTLEQKEIFLGIASLEKKSEARQSQAVQKIKISSTDGTAR